MRERPRRQKEKMLGMAARGRLVTVRNLASRLDRSWLPVPGGDSSVPIPSCRNHPTAAGALPLRPVGQGDGWCRRRVRRRAGAAPRGGEVLISAPASERRCLPAVRLGGPSITRDEARIGTSMFARRHAEQYHLPASPPIVIMVCVVARHQYIFGGQDRFRLIGPVQPTGGVALS